jgi:hypothetical protein
MQTDRTLSDLTKDMAFYLGDMFRNELKLARVEATEGVKSLSGGVGLIVGGAVFGIAALTLAFFAIASGLSLVMPMWAASAIIAVVGGLIALVLIKAGNAALKPKDLSLPRTREQMSRDFKSISEHVH